MFELEIHFVKKSFDCKVTFLQWTDVTKNCTEKVLSFYKLFFFKLIHLCIYLLTVREMGKKYFKYGRLKFFLKDVVFAILHITNSQHFSEFILMRR